MGRPHKYPVELRERSVRMVQEINRENGGAPGAVKSVAVKLGLHPETLRKWVVDADVDARRRPAPPAADRERINKLERENRELRRANDILKSAAFFFAAELDRPSPK